MHDINTCNINPLGCQSLCCCIFYQSECQAAEREDAVPFNFIGLVHSCVVPSQVERQLVRQHRSVREGIPLEVDLEFLHSKQEILLLVSINTTDGRAEDGIPSEPEHLLCFTPSRDRVTCTIKCYHSRDVRW